MKEQWFDYLLENKKYWPYGVTAKRLEKIKAAVFADEDIMYDLLERHNGKIVTPQEMLADNKAWFDHCIGNFACNIAEKMRSTSIVK